MNNCKIYSLNDPITHEIRYIGYTSKSIKERFRGHIKDVYKKSITCHKNRWINYLLKNGLIPEIELLYDGLTKEDAIKKEIELIKFYKDNNFNLTNNTEGGDGGSGYKFTDKQREKLRVAHLGEKNGPCSIDRKLKISLSNKGRKLNDEQKLRMSIMAKKRFSDPQEREKQSNRLKGKKLSENTKKKMSESRMGNKFNIGKKRTDEWKELMREKFKGKKRPDYIGLKISKAKVGKKFSEEHKESLKKAWIKRKENKIAKLFDFN